MADPGGYLDQSTQDNLIVVAAGGHTISGWASGRDWNMYLSARPAGGYSGVWLNLCERYDPGLSAANVQTIINRVYETDPGIPIWLSPLNFYEVEYPNPGSCGVTRGNTVPNQGAVIADDMSADPSDLIFRGPDLGPLTAGMVVSDYCHPNSTGVGLLGSQLVGFFDQ